MTNHKIACKGYSLVELMIVVVVIGILTAIAIPSYEGYSARATVTEGLIILDQMKPKVVDYYNQNASLPPGLSDLNLNSGTYTTTNIATINVTNGVLQVTFVSGVVGGATTANLVLTPTMPSAISGGTGASGGTTSIISWVCSSPDIPVSYLPLSCQH